ncbi:hypothetical protein COU54_01115 [Candidatus Pacearchaeota archaeon CG10_big_fil_rev_8_21_14_0_10_31_24]|nr:MAG: hypothetical protein COU54_01115 [Candidatus Pacearchaeota archaeon CG10_big_fil_rev_8_21_14_0_10_31_24]
MINFLKRYKHYLSNLILIWTIFFFYKTFDYYQKILSQNTLKTLLYLALAYSILGLIYYSLTPKDNLRETKGTLLIKTLSKIAFFKKIDKKEKISLLFIIVKIFFLPLMINFALANYYALKNQIPQLFHSGNLFSISSFNAISFPLILTLIFFIDTLVFALGYAFEAKFLKNRIISVESTFFGWFVTLICYPPFNSYVTKYLDWYANDYIIFSSESITFIMRILIISLLTIYVSATISLGTKASNLTNRGIVSRGPYKYIRHPAYITKNLSWWATIIPILSWPAILSMSFWSIIYHLRAITEEKHLSQDPAYIEYKKKVKYRYIPFIY